MFVNPKQVYAQSLEGEDDLICYNTWEQGGNWSFIQCYGCKRKSGAKWMSDKSTCVQN